MSGKRSGKLQNEDYPGPTSHSEHLTKSPISENARPAKIPESQDPSVARYQKISIDGEAQIEQIIVFWVDEIGHPI